jgi:aminomethyltransferase
MLHTALHEWHSQAGGRMVDFAGWEMPIQYTSISQEHHAVRKEAGMFDIAHMGRIWFRGPDAVRLLDRLLTNHVEKMAPGQVRYSLVCNEDGGILDDVLVYRFEDSCLLVVNGANREKIVDWIGRHREGFDASVEDETLSTFMLALQGPRAETILQPQAECDLSAIRYYRTVRTRVFGIDAVVSRTGYTGEDGFEVIVENASAREVWERLLSAGEAHGLVPCGLGCRDTLRLEAAMPLYGHEMDESTDPLTAGLSFAVKLGKPDFIGKPALESFAAREDLPRRVGLKLEGKRIAREGAAILKGGETIGTVTSGTFSPTLETPIAMGYVSPEQAEAGTPVEIDIRGRTVPAAIVKLPFYRR